MNGKIPKIPIMTNYEPGDITLVHFPFSDISKGKKRPTLVLYSGTKNFHYRLITVAMITSQIDGAQREGDIPLKDWEKENLLHPSLLRLSKIATIEESLVQKKLGELSERDKKSAQKEMKKLFSFWVR